MTNTKINTTPLLQAALSTYQAKRDRSLAELDIYLNKSVGVGEHATVVDEVIKLFSELDNADSVIATIENVIMANQPKMPEQNTSTEKEDLPNNPES